MPDDEESDPIIEELEKWFFISFFINIKINVDILFKIKNAESITSKVSKAGNGKTMLLSKIGFA